MSTGMASNSTVNVGELFNETDSDSDYRVRSINIDANPPIARCVKVAKEPVGDDDSDETEQEYSLPYVVTCVNSRREWNKSGYGDYDVRDVFKMTVKQLKHALTCTRQNIKRTAESATPAKIIVLP